MSDIVKMLRKGEKEGVDGWWGTMAEAADEIERLRAALEKVAVLNRYRMFTGTSVPAGQSCEICDARCDEGAALIHVVDCPLSILNPK